MLTLFKSLNASGLRGVRGGNQHVEAVFEPKFSWASKNLELTGKASTSSDYEGVDLLPVHIGRARR